MTYQPMEIKRPTKKVLAFRNSWTSTSLRSVGWQLKKKLRKKSLFRITIQTFLSYKLFFSTATQRICGYPGSWSSWILKGQKVFVGLFIAIGWCAIFPFLTFLTPLAPCSLYIPPGIIWYIRADASIKILKFPKRRVPKKVKTCNLRNIFI